MKLFLFIGAEEPFRRVSVDEAENARMDFDAANQLY